MKEYGIQPVSLMIPGHDNHGSPAIDKDWLYVPTGNGVLWPGEPKDEYDPKAPHLLCLNKDTGKLVWKDASPGKNALFGHYSSPTILDDTKPVQVVHPQSDGWVRSFDAATGELLWKFDTNLKKAVWVGGGNFAGRKARLYPIAMPVYAEGHVYISTGLHPEARFGEDGTLFCLDPTRKGDISRELDDGPGQGKKNPNNGIVWQYTGTQGEKNKRVPFCRCLGSVAVHEGLTFAVDSSGYAHCLDAKTGTAHWSHDVRSGSHSSPLIVGDKLFVCTEDDVHIFDATKTKKHLLRVEVERTIVAPPVDANGQLFILADGWLYAIGPEPKKERP